MNAKQMSPMMCAMLGYSEEYKRELEAEVTELLHSNPWDTQAQIETAMM